MSKAAPYEPKHPLDEKHTPVASKPYDDFPKDTLKTTPKVALQPDKMWQWHGHNHTDCPEWLSEHSPTVHNDALMLINAPQGVISASKGEWVVKNEKGDVHVTKDAPPNAPPSSASQPSSPQAPDTAS